MTYNKAKTLLTVDINALSLEQLQRHKVKLLDALRESCAEYGFEQAVLNGFYCVTCSESVSGYTPKDIYLSHNLQIVLEKTIKLEQKLFDE